MFGPAKSRRVLPYPLVPLAMPLSINTHAASASSSSSASPPCICNPPRVRKETPFKQVCNILDLYRIILMFLVPFEWHRLIRVNSWHRNTIDRWIRNSLTAYYVSPSLIRSDSPVGHSFRINPDHLTLSYDHVTLSADALVPTYYVIPLTRGLVNPNHEVMTEVKWKGVTAVERTIPIPIDDVSPIHDDYRSLRTTIIRLETLRDGHRLSSDEHSSQTITINNRDRRVKNARVILGTWWVVMGIIGISFSGTNQSQPGLFTMWVSVWTGIQVFWTLIRIGLYSFYDQTWWKRMLNLRAWRVAPLWLRAHRLYQQSDIELASLGVLWCLVGLSETAQGFYSDFPIRIGISMVFFVIHLVWQWNPIGQCRGWRSRLPLMNRDDIILCHSSRIRIGSSIVLYVQALCFVLGADQWPLPCVWVPSLVSLFVLFLSCIIRMFQRVLNDRPMDRAAHLATTALFSCVAFLVLVFMILDLCPRLAFSGILSSWLVVEAYFCERATQ